MSNIRKRNFSEHFDKSTVGNPCLIASFLQHKMQGLLLNKKVGNPINKLKVLKNSTSLANILLKYKIVSRYILNKIKLQYN